MKLLAARAAGDVQQSLVVARQLVEIARQEDKSAGSNLDASLSTLAEMSIAADRLEDARRAAAEMLGLRATAYGKDDWRTSDARRLLRHIEQLSGLDAANRQAACRATQIDIRSEALRSQQQHAEALALAKQALALRKTALGEQHPRYADSLHNNARLHILLHDPQQAEQQFNEALSIRKTLGIHPDVAATLNNIGVLRRSQGDFDQAEKLHREAAEIWGTTVGKEHPLYVLGLTNWAGDYAIRYDFERAQPLFEQALAIRRDWRGDTDSDYLNVVAIYMRLCVAQAAHHEKRQGWATARKARNAALDQSVRLFGAEHWKSTDARLALQHVERLARMSDDEQQELAKIEELNEQVRQLRKQKKSAEAIPILQQVVSRTHKLFGERHPHYILRLVDLARTSMGPQRVLSKQSYEQALPLAKAILGSNHPDYGTYLFELGLIHQVQGDLAGAESLYAESVEIYRTAKNNRDATFGQRALLLGIVRWELGKHHAALSDLIAARDAYAADDASHPEYRKALSALQEVYVKLERYAEAEATSRKLIELGKNDAGSEQAAALYWLATACYHQQKLEQAADYFRQAADLHGAASGKESKAYADTINWLAYVYWSLDDSRKALPLALRAAELFEQIHGPSHSDVAEALNTAGLAQLALGEVELAKAAFEQSAKVIKETRGEGSTQYAMATNNLGQVASAENRYEDALENYRAAAAIYEEIGEDQWPEYAMVLANVGRANLNLNNFAAARTWLRKAADIYRTNNGEERPEYRDGLFELGYVELQSGRLAEAYSLMSRYPPDVTKITNVDQAERLLILAQLYMEVGDAARSDELIQQVLAVAKDQFGEDSVEYASVLHYLADLYEVVGEASETKELSERLVALYKKHLGADDPTYAAALLKLGNQQIALGDYDAAETAIQQSINVFVRVRGLYPNWYADALCSRGTLCWCRRDREGAAQMASSFHEAIERVEQLGVAADGYWKVVLAGIYFLSGDRQRGKTVLQQAIETSLRSLEEASIVQSERQQLAVLQQNRWFLDTCLWLLPADELPAEQVYEFVLAWKGSVFARQRQLRMLRRSGAIEEEGDLAKLYQQLEQTTTRLATLSLSQPTPRKRDMWQKSVRMLSERKEQLERELAKRSETFRTQQTQLRGRLDQLRAALPTDAAVVDFLEYYHYTPPSTGREPIQEESRLVAFVVRPSKPVVRVDLGPTAPISETIERWRSDFVGVSAARQSRPSASSKAARSDRPTSDVALALRKLLWQPLEPHLAGVTHVLLSPDGAVSRVPFAALPGQALGTFLIEDLSVSIVPVPRILSPDDDRLSDSKVEPSLLLIGDVDFSADPAGLLAAAGPDAATTESTLERSRAPDGDSNVHSAVRGTTSLEFDRLPGTRQEIEKIRDLFQTAFPDKTERQTTGAAASEDIFRQQAPQCRVVHIATHGFFAPPVLSSALSRSLIDSRRGDAPGIGASQTLGRLRTISGVHPGLLSGIALAGANSDRERVTDDPTVDDGILTSLEVAALDLSDVDLAVLSACETGLGEVAGGEGVLGLQRAFQVNGTRTTVTSLWKVHDQATQLMMTRFYENLWREKMGKLEALREAQIWMLREAGKPTADAKRGLVEVIESQPPIEHGRLPPYYWAAFVLSGDWR